MDTENIRSNHLIHVNDPAKAYHEIRHISSQLTEAFNHDFLDRIYEDTKSLFEGQYPGYRACNTAYHDLQHTISVALATARLLHGCYLEGFTFASKNALLSLVAALLHDVGLIQKEDDLEGSGAKYTIGHEERSVFFARKYLSQRDFSSHDIESCSNFIRCTNLNLAPNEITFSCEENKTLGKIVGSADLSAQMADRCYLEKLLLLYQEFEEACLPGFDSELVLLRKTGEFYESTARKRLYKEFGGILKSVRSHFRHRWNLDRDLYSECISKNIEYLESLVTQCEGNYRCYLENLRRGGIAKKILDSQNSYPPVLSQSDRLQVRT